MRSMSIRVPRALDARLDALAADVSLTKSALVRYWLAKLGERDLPSGWRQDTEGLRAARATR